MAARAQPAAVDLAAFVAELPGTWQSGGYRARCPAHDDREASLMVNQGRDGRLVLMCHAGCQPNDVLKAMGKTFADLNPAPHVVAEYHYRRADGSLNYTVLRFMPKDFRVRPGLPPSEERTLYGTEFLEQVRQSGIAVHAVEGEDDSETMRARGLFAICNVGGAGKWLPNYTAQLEGFPLVRIIADNDAPGYKHATQVADALKGHVGAIEVFRPAAGCKDISDHFAAGHTMADLLPLEPPPKLFGSLVSELTIMPVYWAWQDYFPLGTICLIEGDPGDGKSTVTSDLTARWSAGSPMPDGSPNPFGRGVGVILIGVEDDPNATVAPRLKAAHCRPDRIKLVTGGQTEDGVFNLSLDLDALRNEILALDAKVVVIDPVTAFLSEGTDSNNDPSTRRALAPLARLAREMGVLVILIRHLNKSPGGKAIYRGGGSIAFVGASRAAYLVSRHPDDDNKRVLAVLKGNLAKPVPSLVYELVNHEELKVPYVAWRGILPVGAQELLDIPNRNDDGRADVQEYLRHICADEALSWADIVKLGKDAGFSAKSLETHRGKALTKQFIPGEGNRGVRWIAKGAPVKPAQSWVPKTAEQVEEPETGEALADTKDLLMRDLAPVCDICHDATAPALKFGRPHWVVRCRTHNPFTYRGE